MTKLYDINWQFIKEREAIGGIASMEGYVPADKNGEPLDKSGVTIAYGTDLGSQTQVFLDALIDNSIGLADKCNKYIGIKGKSAQNLLRDWPLELDDTTEADVLFITTVPFILDPLIKRFDSESSVPFESLNPPQQTVIASVAWQYGPFLWRDDKAPNFWKQITEGRWSDALANLRNFGDKYGPRRNLEADLLV